ncbi:MAG: phosphatidylglycerol lysyltransferase domain-containing protein [Lachnospiraceae bacterium]|nr:phosphatidylglycerol lysyltransferase domain-containing protein [Lachnospiraceae bacterium]
MEFKKTKLEDLPVLKKYFDNQQTYDSGSSVAMLYLWAPSYNIQYAVVHDMLICRSEGSFSFPIGSGDPKPALDELMEYCRSEGIEFVLHSVTKEIEAKMIQLYGDVFTVEYDRDEADYVYLSERLISLSGKKYHGKRNHINRFNENHEWVYETINDDNALECIIMLMQWKINNCAGENADMAEEVCAAKNALMYYKELGLVGGLIRCEGVIIAFSLGEPISDDMFAVHFEKAFSNIQGAYPIINQQFVLHEASEYKYINREEDCGDEGLRKAKLSYRPEMMVEKGILKFREK